MLLATFVAGGLLGPTVHRVQHAIEQVAAASETPCHSPDVHHSEDPVWTHTGAALGGLDCDLCATRLLVIRSDLDPVGIGRVLASNREAVVTHLTSVFVVAAPLIRGPPMRA